jgi:hypothetical protein
MLGSELLVQSGQYWEFKGEMYRDGLLKRKYLLSSVTDVAITLTPSRIDFFWSSQHHEVLKVLNAMSAKLEVGDGICIVLGTYRLLSGWINNICGNNTITFECDNFESYGVVQMFIWEVVRVFDLGDHVEVHCGEHRGVEGFIILKDDMSVLLYVSEGQKQ